MIQRFGVVHLDEYVKYGEKKWAVRKKKESVKKLILYFSISTDIAFNF